MPIKDSEPWTAGSLRPLTPKQKLTLISFTGTLVNDDGRITDHVGYPIIDDRPAKAPRHRIPFDEEDDRTLASWLMKAAAEGIPLRGPRFFKDLELTTLRHTWQSWQRHWRLGFRDNAPNHNTDKTTSGRQDFLRQIERNSNQSSNPSNHNDPLPEFDISLDQTSVGFLQASEISNPSLIPTANHTNGVVKSSELESPINLSGRISERSSVDTSPTHSVLRDNAQAEGPAALTKLPNNSEEALRKLLRLRDRDELAAWLSQDWVANVYIEYYNVTIDHWRTAMEAIEAAGGEISPQERRSSQKFLVRRAADALRSRSPRYVSNPVAKIYWTKDDHDIRFIVRIVDEGRASGRCWERYTRGDHTEYLCAIAYRLMCWLRAMHKITVATSGMSRWHKANCDRWFNFLRHIRDQRAGSREEAATARAPLALPASLAVEASTAEMPRYHDPAQEQALSPQSHMSQSTPLDVPLLPALSGDSPNGTDPEASHDSLNEVWPREHPHVPIQDDDSRVDGRSVRHRNSQDGQDGADTDFTTLNTAPVKIEPGLFEVEQSIDQPNPYLEIPHVPSYRAPRSKNGRNQMKGIEWMTQPGKDRFEAHQDKILGRWGVTAEHAGTCILIPASWSGLDPHDLVNDFSYENCPPSGTDRRLTFSMLDHAVPWARAASWFNSKSWPWKGADFDGFLSIGPYRPKDGSHLCHHGTCINQHHIVYEDSGINISRNRCANAAQDMRLLGMEIPEHCARHDPPCLLQHAALTVFESHLIQFSVFRRAKGLPSIQPPPTPSDHTYPTFEYQLPVSFTNSSIAVDLADLVSIEQPVTPSMRTPILHCRFCTKVNTYRRITALWCHIRDKHTLVKTEIRLQEIVRTGSYWRDHWERERELGHPINRSDPTWIKLEQMREKDFGWEVILAWKISYSAKKEVINLR